VSGEGREGEGRAARRVAWLAALSTLALHLALAGRCGWLPACVPGRPRL
jgi:hypothetical protein